MRFEEMKRAGRPAPLTHVSRWRFAALMLVALLILPAASFALAGAAVSGDFNGDGKSDILWRDSNGQAYIWLINGTALSTTSPSGSPGSDPHNPDLSLAGFGENVAAGWGSDFSLVTTGPNNGLVSEQGWTGEAGSYTFGTQGGTAGCTASECLHDTQEVWRNTTAVGCAVQICTANSPGGASFPFWYFTVCDVVPAGNVQGEAPY